MQNKALQEKIDQLEAYIVKLHENINASVNIGDIYDIKSLFDIAMSTDPEYAESARARADLRRGFGKLGRLFNGTVAKIKEM